LTEDRNTPRPPLGSRSNIARPDDGDRASPPMEKSGSGLDVRKLLGLGRIAPEAAQPTNPPPTPEPEIPQARERAPAESSSASPKAAPSFVRPPSPVPRPPSVTPHPPVAAPQPPSQRPRAPSTTPRPPSPAPTPPAAPRAPAPAPRISTEEPPHTSEPSQRPLRAAFGVFDTKPTREKIAPELSIDPPARPPSEPRANRAPDSVHRPIPPITDPAEFFSLRPPVDPLSARTPLGEEKSVKEDVSPPTYTTPAQPTYPAPPPPSPTTHSRLEELASLSEKSLEDYDNFDDFEDTDSDRPRRTPIIILASLLGVGVLAGGVIYAYRQGVQESSPTTLPVIVAGTKAIKEEPVNPGGVKIPNQNKLIYDRILGEETDIAERIVSREEKVVSFSQQPATTIISKSSPSADTPGSQGDNASSTAGVRTNPATGSSGVAEDQLAKKLAESLPKPQSPPDSLTAVIGNGTTSETLKLPPNIQEQTSAAQGGIVRLDTETVTPPSVPAAPSSASESLAIAKLVEDSIGATPKPEVKVKVPPVLPRRKPPAPTLAPTRIVSTTPQATTPPATAARSTSGNFVIQIAAFRSREEALSRFATLKRRHGKLLGPYTSFVQRADLGDQGIYYRLRLGPIDGKDRASSLCRSLLSAGEKDCLVRTR